MLVLSRKLGEEIVIGEGPNKVVITVVDIDRGKIRLGIQANRDIPVYRKELLPLVRPVSPPPQLEVTRCPTPPNQSNPTPNSTAS